MTDNLGFGSQKRREGNLDILSGKTTFRYLAEILLRTPDRTADVVSDRDAFREMLDSVAAKGHTFEECKDVLRKSAFLTVLTR